MSIRLALQFTLMLSFSSLSLADLRIVQSQQLDSTADLLNRQYQLTCNENGGLLENTRTGRSYEISSQDACNQLKVYARLSDEQCATLITIQAQSVTRVRTTCSIEEMLTQE